MKEVKEKIDMKKAIILSVVMFIVALIAYCTIKYLFFTTQFTLGIYDFFIVPVGYFILILLHECIHGICFIIFGAGIKNIKFGIHWKSGSVYCHSSKPLEVWKYNIVLAVPTIVLGIIPIVFAVIYFSYAFVFMFALMIAGGAGDLMMMISSWKYPMKATIVDDPNEPAYTIILP